MDNRSLRHLSVLLFDFMMFLEDFSLNSQVEENRDYVKMFYSETEFLKFFIDDLLKKELLSHGKL